MSYFGRAGWDLCAHHLVVKAGSWGDPTGSQSRVLGVADALSPLEIIES